MISKLPVRQCAKAISLAILKYLTVLSAMVTFFHRSVLVTNKHRKWKFKFWERTGSRGRKKKYNSAGKKQCQCMLQQPIVQSRILFVTDTSFVSLTHHSRHNTLETIQYTSIKCPTMARNAETKTWSDKTNKKKHNDAGEIVNRIVT